MCSVSGIEYIYISLNIFIYIYIHLYVYICIYDMKRPLLQVGSFFFSTKLCYVLFVSRLMQFLDAASLLHVCLGSPMLVPLLWTFEHVLTDLLHILEHDCN